MIDFETARALVLEMVGHEPIFRKLRADVIDQLARTVVNMGMKHGDTLVIEGPNEYKNYFSVHVITRKD